MTLKITKPENAPPTPGAPPDPAPPKKETAAPRPLVAPTAPSSAKWKQKVILSTLDGKIEWEKMNPESRKAFEELFADPKFLSAFGVSKKDTAFSPKQMEMLYDGISATYQAVAQMFMRWPPQIAKMLAYTEEEKTMLAEPTADLINRFAPALVRDNRELIIFFAVFGSITNGKFMQAKAEFNKYCAEQGNKPRQAPKSGPDSSAVAVPNVPPIIPINDGAAAF